MDRNLQYKNFFNLSQDFMAIVNPNGYFKMVNLQWTKKLGYSEEELLSNPYTNFIHPDDKEKSIEVFKNQLSIHTNLSTLKNRYLAKNGDIIWLEWNITSMDITGEIFVIGKDTTHRRQQQLKEKAIQKNLKNKNKLLEDLFELSRDFIVIANSDGYFKKVNPIWIEKLGYTENELLSTPFMSFIHPDDRNKTSDMVQRQMEGYTAIEFENRYVSKNGDVICLEWNGTSVDATGDIFAIARDQTVSRQQKLKMEAMLKEVIAKNKQLEEFSYISSHNLRSPVANIFVLSKFLEQTNLRDDQKEYIQLIKESAEMLNSTLEDLSEAVQIHKNTTVKIKHISLEKICNDTLKQLSGELLSTEAKIITDFKEINTIAYSKPYMQSIFLNLISNAIKYKSPDRTPVIQIRSKKLKNSVQLVFKDNGTGIDLEKHKNRIFGFRKTFHPNPDARGLGLYITKSQIEALNGKISVSSTINEGTIFTINLAS